MAKGLKSRSGGKVAPGFEGGQMPLKQRLPKFGFTSRKSLVSAEVRLGELKKVEGETVDLQKNLGPAITTICFSHFRGHQPLPTP